MISVVARLSPSRSGLGGLPLAAALSVLWHHTPCEAATLVSMENANLHIVGSDAHDAVVITDDRWSEVIEVAADGITHRFSTNVALSLGGYRLNIYIDLDDGNDWLIYRQVSDGTQPGAGAVAPFNHQATDFAIRLGDGSDYAWLDLARQYDDEADAYSRAAVVRDLDVTIDAGSGNDVVAVDLGYIGGVTVDVDVEGKGGDDSLEVNLDGNIGGYWRNAPWSEVSIDLYGGGGNDTVETDAAPAQSPLLIADTSQLDVKLSGGFGRDHVNFYFDGTIQHRVGVSLDAHGGWGDDYMENVITLEPFTFAGQRRIGHLDATVNGSWGDDTLLFWAQESSRQTSAVVDGDLGIDTCFVSPPNVFQVDNCGWQDQQDFPR